MIQKVQEVAHNHRGKLVAVATAASIGGTTGVSMAAGTTTGPSGVDYGAATSSVSGELQSAALAALPVAGTLIAVFVAWRFARRFMKA